MADICEIGRARECIEAGSHEQLELPGGEARADLKFNEHVFGKVMACKRCGLLYWEPVPVGGIDFTLAE